MTRSRRVNAAVKLLLRLGYSITPPAEPIKRTEQPLPPGTLPRPTSRGTTKLSADQGSGLERFYLP